MPETLDYAPPASATTGPQHLRLWGTFLLVGMVSVPVTEMAVSVLFDAQEPFSVGGLIVTLVCFLLSSGAFALAHTVGPRWFSSRLAAAAFALFGPAIGVTLFIALTT